MKKEDNKEFWRGMYNLGTLGINIVVATFIGLGMGWLLDNKVFHGKTSPWLTLIFLLFGIVAGFRNIYKMTKEFADMSKKDDEDE